MCAHRSISNNVNLIYLTQIVVNRVGEWSCVGCLFRRPASSRVDWKARTIFPCAVRLSINWAFSCSRKYARKIIGSDIGSHTRLPGGRHISSPYAQWNMFRKILLFDANAMRSKGKSYERRRKKIRDEWFFGYERHSQTHNFPHFHFVDKCDYVLRTTNFKYIRTQHTLRNTQNPATQMVMCYLYSSVISTMLLFLVCESFLNHSEFRDGSRHPKQWRSSKRNRKLCPNSGM